MTTILGVSSGIVVGVAYGCFFSLVLLLLIGHSYDKRKNVGANLRVIWQQHSIYVTILIQIIDQASNIGVLTLWWFYADEKNDLGNVNVQLFTILSFVSIISARIFSAVVVFTSSSFSSSNEINDEESSGITKFCDSILCLLELYIIKQVWYLQNTNKGSNKVSLNPTSQIRGVIWIESIFESSFQAVLQSVFIIRVFNSESEIDAGEQLALSFSLIWSTIAVSNAFVVIDHTDTIFDSSIHNANHSTKVGIFVFIMYLTPSKKQNITKRKSAK